MLQTGKISSVELTSHFLQRIDQNPELNAFITVDAEAALTSAREADTCLNGNRSNLLTGLPDEAAQPAPKRRPRPQRFPPTQP